MQITFVFKFVYKTSYLLHSVLQRGQEQAGSLLFCSPLPIWVGQICLEFVEVYKSSFRCRSIRYITFKYIFFLYKNVIVPTRRHILLRGLTSNSCGGLWQRFFCPSGKNPKSIMIFSKIYFFYLFVYFFCKKKNAILLVLPIGEIGL